jgi:hypothetical protein
MDGFAMIFASFLHVNEEKPTDREDSLAIGAIIGGAG